MSVYAVYARTSRSAAWVLRGTFSTQEEADALAEQLVERPVASEHEHSAASIRSDKELVVDTIVEVAPDGSEMPSVLPEDRAAPVSSWHTRQHEKVVD
jgi:hypothetical protein